MVHLFYKKHHVVLAYAEKIHASQEVFQDDIVEVIRAVQVAKLLVYPDMIKVVCWT